MKLETAVQHAFDKANLIGETVDLDGVLLGYKAIRDLFYTQPAEYEAIYDGVSRDLFGRDRNDR